MKIRKKWRFILAACVSMTVLVLAGACFAAAKQEPLSGKFGLFSWNVSVMAESEKDTLNRCIQQAGVGRIYQNIPEQNLALKETAGFIRRMSARSVEVYSLLGDSEWSYEKDGGSLRYELEQIVLYNAGQEKNARIAGVMVDVEPYLLDEWGRSSRSRKKLMERYLSGIKKGYDYAVENRLKFGVCIPVFYDVTNEDILEELISTACDGIALMNYDRTDEYMQIAKEVGYAREYQKDVVCVYELQEPGSHDLEEINTYAGLGLKALWSSATRLEAQFGYERLQFGYHYYDPLTDLLAKET